MWTVWPGLRNSGWFPRRADPVRGAGGDHVSRVEGHDLARVGDEVREPNRSCWPSCRPGTTRSSIRVVRRSACGSGRKAAGVTYGPIGAARSPLFPENQSGHREHGVLAVAAAPVAHVEDDRVAEHVVERFLERHPEGRLPDDDPEFALPVDAVTAGRDPVWLARPDDAGAGATWRRGTGRPGRGPPPAPRPSRRHGSGSWPPPPAGARGRGAARSNDGVRSGSGNPSSRPAKWFASWFSRLCAPSPAAMTAIRSEGKP